MKKISAKTYTFYRLLIVIALSMTVGAFISVGNYVVPLVALVVSMFAMWRLKKVADLRLSDERVEKIGGLAARWTFSALLLLMVFIGIPLITLGKSDPVLSFAGNLLSLLAMAGLLIYSVLFHYFNRKGE
jgi:uncharacterized membrane protein